MIKYGIKIVEAAESDLDDIVAIHMRAFSDFFLSSLGVRFMRVYYKSCLRAKESIFIVMKKVNSNEIIGFAMGSLYPFGFHRRLVSNNFLRFSSFLLEVLFYSPMSLLRLLHNLNKPMIEREGQIELLSICISPKFEGEGFGGLLLDAFENRVMFSGGVYITLTTDVLYNEGVLKFYDTHGYVKDQEFISYPDRPMYRLLKKLREA